jgi:hypothetical protein
MKNKMKMMAGVAAALIGLSATVQAVPTATLTLSDNNGDTTGPIAAVGGDASFVGSLGGWTFNVAAGTSTGPGTQPIIDLSDNSTWGGGSVGNVITITWTVSNLGPLTGAYLESIGGTLNGTSDSFSVLLNGVLLPGSTLAWSSTPFSGTATGPLSGSLPSSITLQAVLTAPKGTGAQTSFDDNLTVPDGGATVMLLGAALSAVGLLRRKLAA